MSDIATPNLPSRDFGSTSQFYKAVGFSESWRDEGWMILNRGELILEFLSYPELEPRKSLFSCCLRLDDLDSFYATCEKAGLTNARKQPRLTAPKIERSGRRIAY